MDPVTVLNDPVSPPADAYRIMEPVLGRTFFSKNGNPPSPPTPTRAAAGPGFRVQITGPDGRMTQWDLTPPQWAHVKNNLVAQPVRARVVQSWDII